MRIRTINPDIWRSEDFTSLSDFGQLMFIGLINYVDDNGVGRYNLVDFAADVFASRLAEDASELLPKISEVPILEPDGRHFPAQGEIIQIDRPDKGFSPHHLDVPITSPLGRDSARPVQIRGYLF